MHGAVMVNRFRIGRGTVARNGLLLLLLLLLLLGKNFGVWVVIVGQIVECILCRVHTMWSVYTSEYFVTF